MLEKFKGIVIKLNDYKEADKLATIFSLEQGVVTAKFAGVKKDNAKLKSVAQPFMFANFNSSTTGKTKTITQADILDDFKNLLSNYNKTMCGYIVLDIIRSILPIEKPEEDLFLLTLSTLKKIETQNEIVATIDYVLKFISFSGMELNFSNSNYVYLDSLTGNFTTERAPNCLQIDKKVYSLLKQIDENHLDAAEIEKNASALKQTLKLLHNIIFLKFNVDIKSFQFI